MNAYKKKRVCFFFFLDDLYILIFPIHHSIGVGMLGHSCLS